MAPGANDLRGYWELLRSRRRRGAWLVVSGFFWCVSGCFGVGTTWSVLSAGHAVGVGDLVSLGVLLLIAAWTGRRARALRGRIAALTAAMPPWLPSTSDAPAAAESLTAYGRRAWAIGLVWVMLAPIGVLLFVVENTSADELLAHGARVPGTVLTVRDPTKGIPSMVVRFPFDGTDRTAEIDRASGRDHRPGDLVTVVYDPADPDRVRTTDEAGYDPFVFFLGIVLLVLSAVGTTVSAVAARGWQRRYRAVAKSGRHAGTADGFRRLRRLAELTVRFGDGSRLGFRGGLSLRTAPVPDEFAGVPVRVGGEGPDMVVLVPRGDGWSAVPVRPRSLRTG